MSDLDDFNTTMEIEDCVEGNEYVMLLPEGLKDPDGTFYEGGFIAIATNNYAYNDKGQLMRRFISTIHVFSDKTSNFWVPLKPNIANTFFYGIKKNVRTI